MKDNFAAKIACNFNFACAKYFIFFQAKEFCDSVGGKLNSAGVCMLKPTGGDKASVRIFYIF